MFLRKKFHKVVVTSGFKFTVGFRFQGPTSITAHPRYIASLAPWLHFCADRPSSDDEILFCLIQKKNHQSCQTYGPARNAFGQPYAGRHCPTQQWGGALVARRRPQLLIVHSGRRKWTQRFRNNWGLSFGTLLSRQEMPTEEFHAKARARGVRECCYMPDACFLLCCMIFGTQVN